MKINQGTVKRDMKSLPEKYGVTFEKNCSKIPTQENISICAKKGGLCSCGRKCTMQRQPI